MDSGGTWYVKSAWPKPDVSGRGLNLPAAIYGGMIIQRYQCLGFPPGLHGYLDTEPCIIAYHRIDTVCSRFVPLGSYADLHTLDGSYAIRDMSSGMAGMRTTLVGHGLFFVHGLFSMPRCMAYC